MTNNEHTRRALYTAIKAATVAAIVLPQFAGAAEDTAQPALEEIVVTAEFREVSSQDVPIAITAFSGKFVQDNFQGSYEIAGQIPNVQIEAPGGFGQPRNSIRGVGQADFNPNAVTPIMVYVDDIALNAAVGQGVPLWDLNRVEVLRGPQGTLFGRNATAGAIRFMSNGPTEETEGMLETTVGEFNQLRIDGAISGSITENLRGRLAFTTNDRDGYFDNVTRGEKEGAFSYDGYRGILEWDVTDSFSITARAQYFESFQETLQFKSTPGLVAGDAFGPAPDPLVNGWESVAALQAAFGFQNLGPGSDFETTEDAHEAGAELRHEVYSIVADWDFDNFTLSSITGAVKVDHDLRLANDSTPAAILDENSWVVSDQTSQEFRVTSTTDSKLQWIAGVYWLQEELTTFLNIDATEWRGNVSYGFPDANTVLYKRGAMQEFETYAAYLHTTYQFSDDLTLTAAARYTTEDKDIEYEFRSQWDFPTLAHRNSANPDPIQQSLDFVRAVRSGNYGTQLAEAPAPESRTDSWSESTWRLSLDYKISDDTLLYGSLSKGFKAGTFKPTANGPWELATVDPETVLAYELGLKSDWWDGRARLNAAVYFYDYKDYQTNQLVPGTATQLLSNMPEAEVFGGEIELQLAPTENLLVSLGVGYADAEITKSDPSELEGNKLPFAEDLTYNGLIRYTIDTSVGTFNPQISFNRKGKYFSTKENAVEIGGQFIVNARIRYDSPSSKYYAALWGKNLGNDVDVIVLDESSEFFGTDIAAVNEIRTFGLTFGVNF